MLDENAFRQLVANGVLIAFDLVCYDREGKVLLGLRRNAPAKNFWFVPGGRIHKNETLNSALGRISKDEIGVLLSAGDVRLLGLYDHIYSENVFGDQSFNTQYIIIAVEYRNFDSALLPETNDQHNGFRFLHPHEILVDPAVHQMTRAYFEEKPFNLFQSVYA